MFDAEKSNGRPCFFCKPGWAGIRECYPLTKRECEILQSMIWGDTEGKTAAVLGISVSTIRTHTQRIHKKLGVHSRAEVITHLTAAHQAWRDRNGPPSACHWN